MTATEHARSRSAAAIYTTWHTALADHPWRCSRPLWALALTIRELAGLHPNDADLGAAVRAAIAAHDREGAGQ